MATPLPGPGAPPGHTEFSWWSGTCPKNLPPGHTKFSWFGPSSQLEFRTINIERDGATAVAFRRDAFAASFGSLAEGNRRFEKTGADGYLKFLARLLDAFPQGAVHAWCGADIVGQLEAKPLSDDPATGHVFLYYVAPRWRGRGVGRALSAHAERVLAAAGCTKGHLCCVPTNARALRFYARAGWRDTGQAPAHDPECHELVKDLAPPASPVTVTKPPKEQNVKAASASPPSQLASALADLRAAGTVVRGCTRLHQLCFQRPGHKRAAVAAGALPLLAAALREAAPGGGAAAAAAVAAERCCACCKAVRTLAFRSPALKDAAGDAGCVDATAAALRACGGSSCEAAAEAALWTLSSLCANHDANIARAQACGALAAVLQCRRAHRGSSAVKTKAMMLVALLS